MCTQEVTSYNDIPLGLWGDQKGSGAFDSPDVYYPFNGGRFVQCRISGYRNFDYWERELFSPHAVFAQIPVEQETAAPESMSMDECLPPSCPVAPTVFTRWHEGGHNTIRPGAFLGYCNFWQ